MTKIVRTFLLAIGLQYLINFLINIFRIPTSIILIFVNLIPILGVVYLGWDPVDLVVLYWFENVVIGLFSFLRIIKAKGEVKDHINMTMNGKDIRDVARGTIASFFAMHYGMFTLVHGVFVLSLFFPESSFFSLDNIFTAIGFILSIIVSHAISFFYNFLYKSEYEVVSPQHYFTQPYKRIIPIHLVIIFGGMLFIDNDSPPIILTLILVGVKIIIDLFAHIGAHAKFQNIEHKV